MDMIEGEVVSSLGGLDGDIVEFSAAGKYIVYVDGRKLDCQCKFARKGAFDCFETWIVGLKDLVTRAIYKREGDCLVVCIAGNYGPFPTALRRDDAKLWIIMKFEKTEPPRIRKKAKKTKKRPQGLIPDGLL